MNNRISLKHCLDLHIHTAPSRFHRLLDDEEAALLAREAGLEAIMIKAHYESTVKRAVQVSKDVSGIKVLGGLVLNSNIGLNPEVVKNELELGARQIWMPTIDARNHIQTFGSDRKGTESEGISILDNTGKLLTEVKEIVKLTGEYNAVIGTAHLSREEIYKLVQYCGQLGVKALITHPLYRVPDLEKDFLKKLTDMGAYVEFLTMTVFHLPFESHRTLAYVKEFIDYIGPAKAVISSDTGQPFNPIPVEALRVYAESLFEMGMTKTELQTMMSDNPRYLVGLEN